MLADSSGGGGGKKKHSTQPHILSYITTHIAYRRRVSVIEMVNDTISNMKFCFPKWLRNFYAPTEKK